LKVIITRTDKKKSVTLGVIKIESVEHPALYTLEEPWLDNRPQVSCIPPGEYRCVPHNWGVGDNRFRFSRVWHVTNVPGRQAILIHSGNSTADIEGCLLVGLRQGKIGQMDAVLDSKKAIDILRSIIGEREFTLVIK
jgi:hypothetical protein